MADFTVSFASLAKGIQLPVGQPNIVRVVPTTATRVRLLGMHFDLDKSFLLPSVMPGIREIKKHYDSHPAGNILVVGHTDTSGNDDPNLTLSVERADAVSAYLRDDVAAWEALFGTGTPQGKRWGAREIQLMLSVLPEGRAPFYEAQPTGVFDKTTERSVREFQTFKSLKVDGIVGNDTRKALITEYMALDGTSLPAGLEITGHGCGEGFPFDLSPQALDDPSLRAAEIKNGVRRAEDRRVEVYFFDGPITPAPAPNRKSGKQATDYPLWLKQTVLTVDISLADDVVRTTPLPVLKGRLPLVFRRNKAFPDPSSLIMVRQFAQALQGDASLIGVVVGHSDAFGSTAEKEALSGKRALAVAAWMTGDAGFFNGQFDSETGNAKWGPMEAVQMMQAAQAPDAFSPIVPAGSNEISQFQTAKGLTVTGLLDRATQAAAIQDYLGLISAKAAPAQLRTVGGGSQLSIFPMAAAEPVSEESSDENFVDPRRAEIFLFAGTDAAAVDTAIASKSDFPSVFKTWCERGPDGVSSPTGILSIRFDDGAGNPMSNLAVSLRKGTDELFDATALAQASTDESGTATFDLPPDAYTATFDTADDTHGYLMRSRRRFPNRVEISIPVSSGS